MNYVKRSILASLLIILMAVFARTAATAHAAPLTCGAWNIVNSPSPGFSIDKLYAVAKISASNVWAVGTADNNGIGGQYQALTENWNGSSWKVVTSPNVGTNSNILYGVAAISASNIWAVGEYSNSGSSLQTLIEHWNGTKWSIVASPNNGTNWFNQLNGITAVSASDIWAVGYYLNPSLPKMLAEHWNGSSWSIVSIPSPSLKGENDLNAVAAVSSSNVWTVGYYQSNTDGSIQTLIEQWNGASWNIVPSPSAPLTNYLNGIVAVSASDVWAVGEDGNFSDSTTIKTLVEQWNGTSWRIVPSPNGGTGNYLNGATAADASHVWAVGSYYTSNTPKTLTEFYC